jgi:hypothetical protein
MSGGGERKDEKCSAAQELRLHVKALPIRGNGYHVYVRVKNARRGLVLFLLFGCSVRPTDESRRSFLFQLRKPNHSCEPCVTKPEISPLIGLIDYVGMFRQIFGDSRRAKRTILSPSVALFRPSRSSFARGEGCLTLTV